LDKLARSSGFTSWKMPWSTSEHRPRICDILFDYCGQIHEYITQKPIKMFYTDRFRVDTLMGVKPVQGLLLWVNGQGPRGDESDGEDKKSVSVPGFKMNSA
jgi:hypothetical protein